MRKIKGSLFVFIGRYVLLPVLLFIVKGKWDIVTRESYRHNQIFRGSLLGIAVLSVLQFINVVKLDKFLFVSLFFFALSIPLLIFSFLIEWLVEEPSVKEVEVPSVCSSFLVWGLVAVALGFVFFFFHLSLFLGVVFLIFCCLLVVAFSIVFVFAVFLPRVLEVLPTVVTSEELKKLEPGAWFLGGVKRVHGLFERRCISEGEILFAFFLTVEQVKDLEQLCEMRKSGVLSEEEFIKRKGEVFRK